MSQAAKVTEDTEISTNLKGLWFLGLVITIVSVWVTSLGSRMSEVESKTQDVYALQMESEKDRIKRREAIIESLNTIKVELSALKTEIRLMRKEGRE